MSPATICRLIVLLFLGAQHALAEDLGSKAAVFAIDRDGREQIKDVVRAKTKAGELGSFWKDLQQKNIAAIKNPSPLGIESKYTARSEIREMKFVVGTDFLDDKGRVVVKRGTVVEPLRVNPLTQGLIFIDGRDARQVAYAIARGRTEPLKIVLTAGSPFDLRVKYQNAPWRGAKTIPFYFDQRKMIINSLNRLYGIDINSVPVTLTQRGTRIQIDYGITQTNP
jgi:conjugal transfer pilus assembly protein TraW